MSITQAISAGICHQAEEFENDIPRAKSHAVDGFAVAWLKTAERF